MLTKYLPYEKLLYQSALSKEDLLEHLKNNIGEGNPIGFGPKKSSNNKSYYGKVINNRFEIMRNINYRNSFIPKIYGEVSDGFNGAKIKVEMKLLLLVKIFMIIWLSITFSICIATVSSLFTQSNSPIGFFLLIPFIMFLFGSAMVIFGFKYESKKSIKDLEVLLKAKIIPQNAPL